VREEQVSIVVGGFSTGGALVVDHYLSHPEKIEGIALFSGALALSENAETLSRIWGIKWVAKQLDGQYNTAGSNPFKYPQVSSFAALQLMDIIRGIRQKINDGRRIQVLLFAAHSDADTTTPIRGIEALVSAADNSNMVLMYGQDEHICHADVVVSAAMYRTLASQPGWQDSAEKCASSRANPKFDKLKRLLQSFLTQLP
jgi:alpha-beta hydrolase superfamily lysophospholipase